MALYDVKYKRLRILHYIDANGDKQELRLPFVQPIDDINIQHSTSISKCKTGIGIYKSSMTKHINRRSPVTIKGIVTSDVEVSQHLEGVIQVEYYKTLNDYLYALNHLESTIIYVFGGTVGTMNVESIQVDSYGKVRNFEITGYRVC